MQAQTNESQSVASVKRTLVLVQIVDCILSWPEKGIGSVDAESSNPRELINPQMDQHANAIPYLSTRELTHVAFSLSAPNESLANLDDTKTNGLC